MDIYYFNVPCNFYPRPPRGGRRLSVVPVTLTCDFYPRPPRGGRLTSLLTQSTSSRFLSTPSARRATCKYPSARVVTCISIHALREEGDKPRKVHDREPLYFYPRPPRGGRLHCVHGEHAAVKFLSTPSARRATPDGLPLDFDRIDFYPRPPRGGRHSSPPMIFTSTMDFYPRPPRGGRLGNTAALSVTSIFLSTPSARRATCRLRQRQDWETNFYPRPPRGGRRQTSVNKPFSTKFLSTPSARRATVESRVCARHGKNFYPRPPRGGRLPRVVWAYQRRDFYPRPPRGGRPSNFFQKTLDKIISIHALREEGDTGIHRVVLFIK